MSKYSLAGTINSVVTVGANVKIVLTPDPRYVVTSVSSPQKDMVLFRPVRDDGRAEVAYYNGTVEIEVSTANVHAGVFMSKWKAKQQWKFEFAPSKQHGDAMIWVCDLSASGALVRKALNKNAYGLKITAII